MNSTNSVRPPRKIPPQTITVPPRNGCTSWIYRSFIRAPGGLHTRTLRLLLWTPNRLSSAYITAAHSSCQFTIFSHQANLAPLCAGVNGTLRMGLLHLNSLSMIRFETVLYLDQPTDIVIKKKGMWPSCVKRYTPKPVLQ
jgi:hypothetical protein